MKRLFLIILLIFASLSIYAQTITKVVSANLNLRAAANTSSTVITVIPKGTLVTVDKECNCEWMLIRYKDKVGYVYSKYLENYNKNNGFTIQNAPKSNTADVSVRYYTNSSGHKVQSPTKYNSPPEGATALCRDGTYSFSRNRRGTCSHHGGVARWL